MNDETLTDIAADIRDRAVVADRHGEAETSNESVAALLRDIANRIDAAARRERDAASLRAIHAVEIAIRDAAPGNAAAVRKALEDTLFLAKKYVAQSPATSAVIFENGMPKREIDYLQAVKNAEAALAAPPRNCDRFATQEEAWNFYFEHVPDNGNIIDGYPEWLFATELIYGDAKAANKEGGKKQ
jgi:hypothetical protein